jgi:3-oxoacyl-[acyl-carrier-protein] synthase-1
MAKLLESSQILRRVRSEEIGLFLGTSTAGVEKTLAPIQAWRESNANSIFGFLTGHHQHGAMEVALRSRFGLRGPGATFATACSSAAVAIGEAYFAVQTGQVKAAIAGGFDVLSLMTILGFDSLQILSNSPCRPFAKDSRGISLGEGGALLLIESAEIDRNRNDIVAYLSGIGASSDGYHITQPQPEGVGMATAIRRALVCAEINPTEISYINAHGTGTSHNDSAEANAIFSVFGKGVPVSSTKGYHGHLLGASGAIEAAVSIAALMHSTSWQGVDFDNLEHNENIVHANGGPAALRHVLSNSFGFGGSNVSLVFSAASRVGGYS